MGMRSILRSTYCGGYGGGSVCKRHTEVEESVVESRGEVLRWWTYVDYHGGC